MPTGSKVVLVKNSAYKCLQHKNIDLIITSQENYWFFKHFTSELCNDDLFCSTFLLPYNNVLFSACEPNIDIVIVIFLLEHWQVFGSDMVYWMNFAIFFFAWNLYLGHAGIGLDADISCTFNIVDNLLKHCIKGQLSSAQPLLASPGSNLPLLTQLISESFSWHLLIIHSHFRSTTIPSGKKKKKNGQMNHELSPLLKSIQCSIPFLKCVILDVKSWAQEQINQPVDQRLDFVVCRLHEEGGPGNVLRVLEQSLLIPRSEIGDLTENALESWNSVDVAKKFIDGQLIVLSELSNICESKLKLLDSMKFPN